MFWTSSSLDQRITLSVSNSFINDPVIADHFGVHCNLVVYKLPNPKLVVSYRNLRTGDSAGLSRDISESALCLKPASELSQPCNQYDTVPSSILDKTVPLCTCTKTIVQRPNAP